MLLSKVEHKLFAAYCRGDDIRKLKSSYQELLGITARQFNAIRISLEGKIRACLALLNDNIEKLQRHVTKLKRKIAYRQKQNQTPKIKALIHRYKRKLNKSEHRLDKMLEDKEAKRVRLCLGSKKLFNAQHHLEKNGYDDHSQWYADFDAVRHNQFFLVGSKDETGGNQSCTATINADETINLRIRLPNAIKQDSKYLILENIKLYHGKEAILSAIQENQDRARYSRKAYRQEHGDIYQNLGIALSYRFINQNNRWFVHISVEQPKPKSICDKRIGLIGVDINADHLAVTEIDRTGNAVHAFDIPLVTYGLSSEQAKAIVGDAIAKLVTFAADKQKPLVIEELEFSKKKAEAEKNKHKARMLSSFSYMLIKDFIRSRSFRAGIDVYSVNPAYSSVIGRVKFARQCRLTVHQSAAMVIARRHMGYSERLPRYLDKIPDGNGSHVTLPTLVKMKAGHVWRTWAVVAKYLKGVLAAQRQMIRGGGEPPPLTRYVEEPLPF